MKRFLACTLILCLLPFSALSEGWLGQLFSGFTQSAPGLRFVSVSDRAFDAQGARVIGANGDKSKILIASAFELYLWDTAKKRRLPIAFTAEEDIAQFNFLVETAYVFTLLKGKTTQEAAHESFVARLGAYLEARGRERLTSFDEVSECFPMLLSLGASARCIGSRYAVVDAVQLPAVLLIDMETGACALQGDKQALLHGDTLYHDGELTDLVTGESRRPEYPLIDGEASYRPMQRDAKLLGNGSLLILSPANAINKEDNTRQSALYCYSTDASKTKLIALGAFSLSKEPSRLLVTGDGRYAAACPQRLSDSESAMLIDLESGEVRSFGADAPFPVQATQDAFICYDYKNASGLFLLDPQTLETSRLNVSGYRAGTPNLTIVSDLTANGEGLYFAQREALHGFFELTDK